MPQFLVAIQHPENYDPSLEGDAMIRDIGVLNEEMDAAGARFFAGGLESASRAKSLRKQPDGKVSVTDGPYLETKEHIGGFWILECADMDEALAWGRKAVLACRVPVEVRAFHRLLPNRKSGRDVLVQPCPSAAEAADFLDVKSAALKRCTTRNRIAARPKPAQPRRLAMRRLRIFEHISLDGVIQQSADENGFPYIDWSGPYRTPAGRDLLLAMYGVRFDLLLGRRTYDGFSIVWPKAPSSPMADAINAAKKYVVTHRPESLAWGPFEGVGPDIVDSIRRIKSLEGLDLILFGSSTLTSTVVEHGLADEVVLLVNPVLLGIGKRFFAEGTPARALELTSAKAMPFGIVINSYKAAGALKKQA